MNCTCALSAPPRPKTACFTRRGAYSNTPTPRSDAARSQGDRNNGLGLAIVAAIARMHGGQAFAESGPHLTRIGLSLPAEPHPQQPQTLATFSNAT